MDKSATIEQAKKLIEQADAILIFAGAGMSVDSGLPDFRSEKGFWNAYPVAEKLGLTFADLATPKTFNTDSRLAWAFYGHRLNLYRKTEPHIGYKHLLDLCTAKQGNYFVFTSNVDGAFQKAGFDNERVLECHGSINRLQCLEPCDTHLWGAENLHIEINTDFRVQGGLPSCSLCGGIARPNILMFNDLCWVNDETERKKLHMYHWWQDIQHAKHRVVVIEIGAGNSIKTVRFQSSTYSNYEYATLLRINPFECSVDSDEIGLILKASVALTSIVT